MRIGLLLVRATIPVSLFCAMLPAGHAHAQEDLRIGSVRVHLQPGPPDHSFATLTPDEGGSGPGALIWACGGDPGGLGMGVLLPDSSGSVTRVVWRVDQDEPDTVALHRDDLRSRSALSFLLARDVGSVTARARRAERLVIQVPGEPPSRPAAEYRYSLAGLDSALNRMGCAASSQLDLMRAGMETLRILEFMSLNGPTGTPEPVVLEEPELTNRGDLARHISRNYPPLQRDSGVSGRVLLHFRVLESGSVDTTSIQVVQATRESFGTAAARVLWRARFRPARVNGRPVKAWSTLRIHFDPQDSAPSGAPAEPPSRPGPSPSTDGAAPVASDAGETDSAPASAFQAGEAARARRARACEEMIDPAFHLDEAARRAEKRRRSGEFRSST